MARPRIFISSTYFDLKSVRADLEHFVREQGFDPVLHERGNVAYGSTDALEKYCYKEIENCDILVSIVGGRFGTQAADSGYSVSQMELRVALEQEKQVYIFVESGVYHEFRTFEKNKSEAIKWAAVDDIKIYEFLAEVYSLKHNNPIQPFETSYDITSNLKEQWSGLFQRLLTQQSLGLQASMFHDLKQSLEAVRSLVDVAASQADRKDEVVASIILLNHPFFAGLRKALKVPYRFVVETKDEFEAWIGARGFSEDIPFEDGITEWSKFNQSTGTIEKITVSDEIFDGEGRLKPFTSAQWSDKFVAYEIRKRRQQPAAFDTDLDADVPF